MNKNLASLVKISIALSAAVIASKSVACSPPPTSYAVQGYVMAEMFKTSSTVSQKISELAGRNGLLQSVTMTKEGILITLNNKCSFVANSKWEMPKGAPGRCPQFGGFTISNEACSK